MIMNNFTNIFFDFDGTIFDTSPGIFASMECVVKHYQLNYDQSTFIKMIGPSLKESFTTIFHLPEEEVPNAIKVYRSFYSEEGMFMCNLYPGVIELIQTLKENNKKIFVATSKPEFYTRQILEKKELLHLFDYVGGADLEEKNRISKVDVINYVLDQNNLQNSLNTCLMVGDRKYDIEGAHQAHIKAMGILWGFGNKEEFNKCNADFICSTPQDVQNFILSN